MLGSLDGVGIDAAVLAVKPGDVATAAGAAAEAGATRLLSIAAGVPDRVVEGSAPGCAWCERCPTHPRSSAPVPRRSRPVRLRATTTSTWAEEILRAVGTVVRVPETALDAVTGLSGSGPAYLFLVAEAMIDAGVHAGLAREVSAALVRQLFVGSARLLAEGEDSAEALRANVTSPGGTTAAGLAVLERAAVRAALIDAVAAATERSRALGREIAPA